MKAANADTNLTVSIGVKPSLVLPPMVPLKPEIDLINAITIFVLICKDKAFH